MNTPRKRPTLALCVHKHPSSIRPAPLHPTPTPHQVRKNSESENAQSCPLLAEIGLQDQNSDLKSVSLKQMPFGHPKNPLTGGSILRNCRNLNKNVPSAEKTLIHQGCWALRVSTPFSVFFGEQFFTDKKPAHHGTALMSLEYTRNDLGCRILLLRLEHHRWVSTASPARHCRRAPSDWLTRRWSAGTRSCAHASAALAPSGCGAVTH